MAMAQGRHGVGALVPTIFSGTVEEMRRQMGAVREALRGPPSEPPAPVGGPARVLGVHLEGPFLNPSRCGALDPSTFLDPSPALFMRLAEGFEDLIRIVTIAPELPGALPLITLMAEQGIRVSMGHSDATWSEAEAAFHAGAPGVTHLFNAMRGFHHREPGLAGFGLLNPHVYVEVIADPHHLDRRTLELIFAVKEPSRIMVVSDTVREVHTGPGGAGMRDERGVLSGGSLTVTEAADRLIGLGIPRDKVYAAVTENPARYLA